MPLATHRSRECPLWEREVTGSIAGRDISKSLNWFYLLLAWHSDLPAPVALLVECLLRGMGGHEFTPGPRHIKIVKNCTSCTSPGPQTYGLELGLVDPVSV